ncbi:RimK family alpha-L-glutamate ligase [Aquamicrobium sp. LC103]|uniref:ATP-grasp domain-containing protein n=1 Tax=Aquamicrobium sp. LC103 TaxID=1120658 RepID=UPI0009E56CC7|nr:RimK family alpha-L-glutamate ligase [Aquamicrobium sp. LC103]TKT69354.1 RimK family alpha-L-glutamate ligase [Aquamicrobium sp. LC103]
MAGKILIANDGPDKQSRRLAASFRRRGWQVATAPLSAIAFDTGRRHGLAIPGLDDELPDGVIVRSISAGSFEAITRRLGVLHALGRLDVPVWNSAQAIERCVDKSMTTFLLADAGLPTPATFTVEKMAAAREVAERELASGMLVSKPLFGAQGRGIRLIRSVADLPGDDEVADVHYLQRYVERAGPPFHDYRVFVCAGKVLAGMTRRGEDWITNIGRGAAPERFCEASSAELGELALAAAAAVGADFAGVDIVRSVEGGLHVLEVNSMPAWSGLQSVTPVDIADEIAAAMTAFLRARRPLRVVASSSP